MAVPAAFSALFNTQLRRARRLAKLRLDEARKLRRRFGNNLSQDASREIDAERQTLVRARRGNSAEDIEKAAESLDKALDKHLASRRKPTKGDSWLSIVVAVAAALLLRAFVFEAFKIPSGSMIPTLAIGDQIFVNKYVYGIRIPFTTTRLVDFSEPDRGDVVVFVFPSEPHEDYIKRVVGLPGDTVELRDGQLYINEQPVPRRGVGTKTYWDRDNRRGRWHTFEARTFRETLGEHTYKILHDVDMPLEVVDFGPRVVPEGHFFVMGDNRDNSHDSRAWGFVPESHLVGRAMFVWWSWGHDGLNTERLGTWIE